MKKVVLLMAFFTLVGVGSYAQEIGFRFGNVSGGNVAVDGIFSTGDFSRIHADVSFGNGIGVDLLWDFLYKPLGDEALNWYAGVGPYAFIGDPFQLGVIGEIGIEYLFKEVPIALGVDWRPYFRLIDNTDFGAEGFGVNVRWVF
jgi:hypothetical protein